MKRALIITTTLAVLGSSVPRVEAGDKEWAAAGKVLAGVGAGLLLARVLEPQPVYTPPVYVRPVPDVYQPAPVVVHQPAPIVVKQVVHQPAPLVVKQVVRQPAPQVIVQSQPTIVYTQPGIVHQPAVVYQPAPVVYVRPVPPPVRSIAPRPVLGFHFSIGHPRLHGHHGHDGYHHRRHRH